MAVELLGQNRDLVLLLRIRENLFVQQVRLQFATGMQLLNCLVRRTCTLKLVVAVCVRKIFIARRPVARSGLQLREARAGGEGVRLGTRCL